MHRKHRFGVERVGLLGIADERLGTDMSAIYPTLVFDKYTCLYDRILAEKQSVFTKEDYSIGISPHSGFDER